MARRVSLCLVTLLFLSTAVLRAQLNRSVIEGIVTDPQGAVVPGAEVIALSLETNVSSPTRTNNTGYYRLPNLVPGSYRARFVATGFALLEVLEIEAPAGQVVRVDAQLKLGTSHELVQVTAELPLLETSASNFSASVEERSIQEIPLQGQDLQQLVFLFPGVANVAGPPGSNFGFNSQFGTFPDPTYMQGSDLAVNGGQGGANAWYLDGNLNLSGLAENVAVNPSPDSVGEFQVVTNGFAAEYGRTGGGVFSVVLRSGSNALHGNLYELARNSATNARNPFTSIDSAGNLIKDRDLHFNNFGGTLGGPLVIPHLYDGRNKTFFFFSFDHQILHLNGHQVFSVPTVRMRQGDFSEDPDSRNFGIWNPYSTVGPDTEEGLFARTAFGTPLIPNGCLNSTVEAGGHQGIQTCNFSTQLPANLLDPTAMFFVQSFPLPNYNDPLSGCPMGLDGFKVCNNYLGGVGSSQNPYNISIKIDHQTSSKSKYFGEWVFNPGKYNIYRLPWTGPTFPSVGWGGNLPFDFKNQVVGLGHTYIPTSTLLNEFRASFSRQFITAHPSQGGFPEEVTHQTEVTQKLAPSRIFVAPPTPSPTFYVGMPGGGSAAFGPAGFISMETAVEAYTLLDNVTKTLGRHTLKAGFLYRLEHAGRTVNNPTFLNFSAELTHNPNTNQGGPGLPQFMLGAVDNSSFTGLTASPYQRSRYWGFYFQDDFRITPKFTLNLGLRYDLNGFFKTRVGPMSNFCLTCPNPTTGLKGKMIYWGDPEFPDGHDMAPANKNSLGPRVNFSWAPFADRKTIIRGGYDLFYTNAGNSYNNIGEGIAPGPQWQTFNVWTGSFYPGQCAPFSGQCVAFPLSDTTTDKGALTQPPVPSDLQFPAAHRDPSYGATGIQFYDPPPRDPMVQMWSLDIQRELPGNMMIDLGYVGTHGTHLAGDSFRLFNYVHTEDKLKYRTAIYANVPITDIYGGKTAELLQQAWGSPTLPLGHLLVDYPFFGDLYTQTAMDGTTIYHGMNVRVQKRYSNGLNFLVAYTWSKKINNASTAQLAAMTADPIHFSRSGLVGGRIGSQPVGGPYGGGYQDPDNRNADRSIAIDDIPHLLNVAGTYDLPFGKGKAWANKKGILSGVVGGWRFSANFNAQSGTPLSIFGPCNELMTCRPNLIGNPRFSSNRTKEQRIAQWINPAAFEPVFGGDPNFWANYDPTDDRAWHFGTAGLYLPGLRSPGFWNLDAALAKDFHLTESKYFQLRWEVFNALNHQNLGLPNTGFCLPPGPNGETDAVRQAGCQFGRITNVQTDPRSMQFALKFYW